MGSPAVPSSADTLIPLAALAERRRVSYSTLLTWVRRGAAGHRLQARRVGARWWSCEAWYDAFQERCQGIVAYR